MVALGPQVPSSLTPADHFELKWAVWATLYREWSLVCIGQVGAPVFFEQNGQALRRFIVLNNTGFVFYPVVKNALDRPNTFGSPCLLENTQFRPTSSVLARPLARETKVTLAEFNSASVRACCEHRRRWD